MPIPVAYFWGDDALLLRRAVEQFARQTAADEAPLERWQVGSLEPAAFEAIAQRLGSAPLFGGGVCVVVSEPLSVLRSRADQDRAVGLLTCVAPGNALVFTELAASGAREPGATSSRLRAAIEQAGGTVRRLEAPRAGQLETWIAQHAADLGIRVEAPAAKLLAERVGGDIRESDVDRRYQTQVVEGHLELLALYRPDGPIRRADVEALVVPAVPASTWAFLDAIGKRQVREASLLASRLLAGGSAIQAMVAQLHRRLRQLLEIRERLAAGATVPDLVRSLHLNPYRAEVLARQAMGWSPGELETALDGLLEVDLVSKGLAPDGRRASSAMTAPLALWLWLVERVAPA
jgi:DNA polymerase III delta subunit